MGLVRVWRELVRIGVGRKKKRQHWDACRCPVKLVCHFLRAYTRVDMITDSPLFGPRFLILVL
jgi:hypothetical protein